MANEKILSVAPCLRGENELSKYPRIGISEEYFVQRADGLLHIVFFNHETDVNLRRALGNHTHVSLRKRAKNFGCDPASAANVLPNQTDDRFASFVLHIRELLEVGCNRWDGFSGIDR